jgi:tetratricopeptide (TPR) repeat protein
LFLSLGGLLIFAHNFILETLLRVRHWSVVFYPGDYHRQALFIASAHLALIPAGCLCLITAWGLKRDRRWTRLSGMIASLFLIAGFPWLTPFGIFCFVILASRQPVVAKKKTAQEFWDPGRQSLLLLVLAAAGYLPLMMAWAGLLNLAGLTTRDFLRVPIVPLLILARWLYLPIHEFGHAAAAWIVGFHLREIAIGPMVMSCGFGGWRFKFEWKRVLQGGGYVGAGPCADGPIRLKQIFLVACGPLASLMVGFMLAVVFFAAPVPVIALIALMGVYDFILNLLPLGYTDGTVIFHLAFNTRQGDALLARILALAPAPAHQMPDDREGTVETRRSTLQRLLEQSPRKEPEIAQAALALGCAEAAADRHRDAECHLRQALEIAQRDPADLAPAANCWSMLHRVYLALQRPDQAREAFRAASEIQAAMYQRSTSPQQRLHLRAALAELLETAQEYEPALAEIDAVLREAPKRNQYVHGVLLRLRASCEFELGHTDAAMAAAREAAGVIRTAYVRHPDRRAAIVEFGQLGLTFWLAGLAEPACIMLTTCVQLLETHGAQHTAANWRLVLADMLLQRGLVGRAGCVLPPPDRMPGYLRRELLQERGAILLRCGRVPQALADYEEMMRLTLAERSGDPFAIAEAKARLSEAYLEAGDMEKAETLVQEAHQTFTAEGRREAADTGVTLALLRYRQGQPAGAFIDEARRLIAEDRLLRRGSRARQLERLADRLEMAGRIEEAAAYRNVTTVAPQPPASAGASR